MCLSGLVALHMAQADGAAATGKTVVLVLADDVDDVLTPLLDVMPHFKVGVPPTSPGHRRRPGDGCCGGD